MNKQRKVVITTTYNEMGIIIDTKAEELGSFVQPEPCEDAVSRKDCLQALSHLMDVEGFRSGWAVSRANVECMLKAMPSVMPKQRMGKWIKLDMHRGMADHKCTACEQECYVPTCMGEPMYAFCPNCGSYNGGEQDDSF